MFDPGLSLPLVLCLAGALAALVLGHPWLQRRVPATALGWGLAVAPLAAFGLLLARTPALDGVQALTFSLPWLPTLGLNVNLYFDHLSALFGLLITGIGALVVVYAGYYFKGEAGAWRFFTYLLLFMTAMLGVVLAGDIVTLFIFWEGTSLTSFLLVAYKHKDEAARRGAFKALFITGGGGIALLAGLLLAAFVAGGADFQTLLAGGDALRASPLYPALLGLIAFGAFTKSAQFPAHLWLPDAMSAPTPASAFLHSATMVKAGLYLMARLNPALGDTDLWFWLLSGFGLATMLAGAYLGLKQNDLKALLAYSTIAQLGVLMMLIGQDTEIAFKALVIGILAHALYKSALFLVAGIVDHEAGTRDLRRLGGLQARLPASFAVGAVAALSMAGLPPLFGFLAKETLLATATHPSLPAVVDVLFPTATVIAGALILAQAALFVGETFLGRPRDASLHPHEAPWPMWLAPALPAVLSLAIGLLPEPRPLADFLAGAAAAAAGGPVKVSLALWTGLTVPLALSGLAIALGCGLVWQRDRVRAWQGRMGAALTFNRLYEGALGLIDRAAFWATRSQAGPLRRYLAVLLAGLGVLIVVVGRPPLPDADAFTFDLVELPILRGFTLLLSVAAAGVTVVLRRDLYAILALGASGLGIATLLVLEPAPDVALVQVVVDILTTVILVLALSRLPARQRAQAAEFTYRQSRFGLARDSLLALGAGLVMALLVFSALSSRPRTSVVTPYYEQNSKPLTGANDIVGAIVVDFRGFDTLIEITVFSLAGLGIYTLLRHAARHHRDEEAPHDDWHELAETDQKPRRLPAGVLGIAGATSPFVHALAYFLLPLSLVVAVTHMIYGHDQPGDGFTAGVIASLGIGLWYVVFGYDATRHRLGWLRPRLLIAGGWLLALASATAPALMGSAFFAPMDFGARLGLPLPKGLYLSTSLLFEVAIGLAVLGSASLIIDALGHPKPTAEAGEAPAGRIPNP